MGEGFDVAEELAGAPLTSVVAGFHLMDPSGGAVEDEGLTRSLARELAARPARYLTCHCTGTDAFALLRDELGGRVSYLHVGSRETLGSAPRDGAGGASRRRGTIRESRSREV